MRYRWPLAGLVALATLAALGGVYRSRLPDQPPPPSATTIARGGTPPPPSETGWKPVPAQIPTSVPRVTALSLSPQAIREKCGTWDGAARGDQLWKQRECAARLASEEYGVQAGSGVYETRAR